uniref:C-type lectin domain-containing protein n=1 Tax=Myripristis murdjan TaxID=586833 RepID=A0A668AE02_9TELE
MSYSLFLSTERICKKCHDSWTLFQTKCYYFSSRMLTWRSSRAWCKTQGGDLAIIDNKQEQVGDKIT